MKILIVTHYFAPDSGAAAVRLSRLARLLVERGHAVTVLTTMPHYPKGVIAETYRGKGFATENIAGVQVVRTWLWTTPSPSIGRRLISQISFMIMALLRGLFLARPDVVLIEAQPMFTGVAGWLLSTFKHRPYVLNVSDLWPDHLLAVGALTELHPFYRISRALVDFVNRGAAQIAVMSPAWGRAIAARTHQPNRITTIYNAVDLERFRPGLDDRAFRERYNLGSAQLVTFIGTFATQYDIDAMFDVAVHLSSRPDVRVVFIGAGTQGDIVRAAVTHRQLDHIILINWVSHDEIPFAWASTTVCYWMMRPASLFEGTIPAKLYEALASGVPVAAGIAGEGAAMLTASGGGIAVQPGDVTGLVRAVDALLDDANLWATCSQNGRRFAEARFEPSAVAAAYERVLAAVVGATDDRMSV